MSILKAAGFAVAVLGLLAGTLTLTSCNGTAAPTASRPATDVAAERGIQPVEGDAAPPSDDAATGEAQAPDEKPAEADTTDATKPDETKEEEEEKIPDYLRVIARFDATQPAVVQAQLDGLRRIVIDTDNVSRLQINRHKLELSGRYSITLRVDGQGIEWTPRYDVVELERSRTGAWSPVRPIKPTVRTKP